MNGGGLHHLYTRKRVSKKLEPYPSRSALKRLLDRIMYAVAVVAPLALVPQTVQLYTLKNADGLALSTWAILTAVNCMWALYGLVHREMPIIITNVALIVLNCSIVVGILLYS
ncbi:hypothetical protein A3D70_00040 [Candidatus Adlerbacteria bacterium RIFCSPHIGHO2_02_FULL_54_18]|uniref:MtN3 and saliva related transmembrane protein n=2 Tax=Candidatus Adleribacteriota TaxID=1752736 RepID=A0A1F4Y3I5_9BACT|nr:MAG: hypothetical protein A2949_01040 [Candidatus Adlerbacteria bacterium RIFCSPLOWO2_01_FULL_54_21b]OGC87873.1 MAG: hypothetical protein A3D70_00040 [Candidatus Adlerbacteria bacterium RIFCSPHIGHO2_02_FULL_54_18]